MVVELHLARLGLGDIHWIDRLYRTTDNIKVASKLWNFVAFLEAKSRWKQEKYSSIGSMNLGLISNVFPSLHVFVYSELWFWYEASFFLFAFQSNREATDKLLDILRVKVHLRQRNYTPIKNKTSVIWFEINFVRFAIHHGVSRKTWVKHPSNNSKPKQEREIVHQ